ncbi:MAG: glycosyltransferase family 2 protein [Deltaproteobacteria bacterium]|nr:glycosyltransferase family 2 protein [Candidatus Zymogenaceae bacterium]
MKLCVLVPAYNCAHFLPELVERITLPGKDDEIIVVDDSSDDDTEKVAKSLPRVIVKKNPKNLGYGGTSQRLYELAAERGADITINMHGDLGHRPEDMPLLFERLQRNDCDIVVGSRLQFIYKSASQEGWLKCLYSPELRGGMPLIRLFGHVATTTFQNLCFGTNLHSFHEGMRGCSRPVIDWILKTEFSTWYNYDVEVLLSAYRYGFRIAEIPVAPNYTDHAKSSAPPFRYGLKVVEHAWKTYRGNNRK